MSNPMLIRSYVAGTGGVGERRVVKFGAADGEVVNSAAAADAHIGICIQPGGATVGQRADVAVDGIVEVIAGGTITRGALLTSDANGAAVVAAPAAGTNNAVIGRAMVSAVAGDFFPVLLSQGSVQG